MLIVSTLAFTVCFTVWMMFGVIGVPITKTLNHHSTGFVQRLALGLSVGLAGGSFSVGTYVARWVERKQQGFAMGVHGPAAAVSAVLAAALWLLRGGATPDRRPGTARTTTA